MKIDVNFDFRQDSKCSDPDVDSRKLYEVHKLLWRKALPSGNILDLEVTDSKYGRLLLRNNLYDNLSSDRMCPHFDRKYKVDLEGWVSDLEKEELKHKVRTIGGHIIFPAHKKGGFTVNQARGVNKMICDRFDLTLECIRLFYLREHSPLYDTLIRYRDFFELFVNFHNYVDFFMLQDYIGRNGQINFSLPFDNFNRSPLPKTSDEYAKYKNHVIDLINSRNSRIKRWSMQNAK